jgi:uncharacterized 2Fe-2S/4Fe-4S cluster protein (DUF4445 family)
MMDSKSIACSVRFEPSGLKLKVPSGTTLLEAVHRAGIYLSSICGGDGYCGKCKAIINRGQFHSTPSPLLSPEEIRENIVLACQTKVLSDLTVAGGFGNFLNVERAVIIGMLPDVPPDRLRFIDNTSITGAKMVLMSRKAVETAEQIAESMTYFDLMSNADYMDEFIKAKFLSHTDLSLFPSVRNLKLHTLS